jgi:TnpA family transposase
MGNVRRSQRPAVRSPQAAKPPPDRNVILSNYEGHAILDFVAENRSLLQPSTIHSDTHGQSAAIFGLADLLGIELMPRIRSWQDLHLFRPDASTHYEHIDSLFTAAVDWALIEAHLPDMLRVALSIRAGRLLPSCAGWPPTAARTASTSPSANSAE